MRFLAFVSFVAAVAICADGQTGPSWKFVVSGDSRNCGNIVMPAIAKGAIANNANFYWHLGDFRAIYRFDQDYAQEYKPAKPNAVLSITDYLAKAWPDFIDSQLSSFGQLPIYLALGNHELVPPKTRAQVIDQFADWFNAPALRAQRLLDDPADHGMRAYYHWLMDGVDFVTLDNASPEQFDAAQLKWIKSVLDRDGKIPQIRAVVFGMHEALPDSLSENHSMNQSPEGTTSGRQVYQWLVDFRSASKKPVYVLASHSHYYMRDTFNSAAIRARTEVLPGWIVGTAGAERYELPPEADPANSISHVYGYLVGTVTSAKDDPVAFEFKQLDESDVPPAVVAKYTQAFVHDCWVNNPQR